ncbi:MAG TPA: prepilin-type N-terminal cleavage/methylation domain-containing protein [Nitrosomonas sp.]|nr:prepilin-type N-terminal cleavage/methylation domain-containing protein [Nitrosomonas sp.]HQX13905.1 prepilin-type N-terminal cleavage/methylation domain-containing protein [Nitrosomonas sp.]HRB20248.1 prepilin-type N-terminal cleavage/methylation domain-containing protein [Nitrosomonas sp.]HRB33482.1 prepilin-type N-terminal cleavage/methylation domain-containing protein [Nitrosomonas sp.]HRB46102.1 prepilin-type N-terminal cleavage/methylation domain-containing protein [Nitrosomonas sp.]
MKAYYHLQRAFTLIELLIVIAIIGILVAIAVPAYNDYIYQAKATQAVTDISAIGKSLVVYQMNSGKFPSSLAEVGAQDLLDPWGNHYQYLNLSDPNNKSVKGKARKDHNLVPINSDFDLYSMGKDGKSTSPLTAKASRDDIVRANNGRYIGLASKY